MLDSGSNDLMTVWEKGSVTTVLALTLLVILCAPIPASAAGKTLIVGFDEGVSKSQMRHLLVSAGVTPVRDLDLVNAYEIQAGTVNEDAAVDRLSNKQGIDFVEDNPQLELDSVPNDPIWAQPVSKNHWGLHNDNFGTPDADIDATEAWNVSTGSDGVVVAVIDTGADYSHPDLRDNIWVNAGEVPGNGIDDDGDGLMDNTNGYDFGDNDPDPYDDGGSDTGHGTAVTGIIGAAGNNAMRQTIRGYLELANRCFSMWGTAPISRPIYRLYADALPATAP